MLLWSGESSVLSSTSATAAIGGVSVSVPTVSLDRAIAEQVRPHVAVKIDAEGAEVEMLEVGVRGHAAAIDELVPRIPRLVVPDAEVRCQAVLIRAGSGAAACPQRPPGHPRRPRRRALSPAHARPAERGVIDRNSVEMVELTRPRVLFFVEATRTSASSWD